MTNDPSRRLAEQILRGVKDLHEEHNPSEPLSRGTSIVPHAGAEHIGISPVGRWYATAVKHLQEDGATDGLTTSGERSGLRV